MRYNRSTREIEITVGDLCGVRNDDSAISVSSIYEEALQCTVDKEIVNYKYIQDDITFSLKLELTRHGDAVCEIAERSEDGKLSPIKQETCIMAFAYCSMQSLSSVNIESAIVQDDGMSFDIEVRNKTYESLEKLFVRKLARLAPVAAMLRERGESILSCGATVKFPSPTLRKGQRAMMNECYDAMLREKRLFVQAPTGIGKTLSTLYPAVKFLGNGKCDKIFYLTAKSSTQTEAYRAAGTLFASGALLRTIVITAKEQMCCALDCMTSGICDAVACPFAKYSEEQIREAVNELLALQNGYEKNVIVRIAYKHKVCPYELSLCLAEFCEIIIADYNYVFDPSVYFRRFFADTERTDEYVFLIDEAHNLADRAREMYSSELSTMLFERLRDEVSCELPQLAEQLDAVISQMHKLKHLCYDNLVKDDDGIERGFYLSRERYDDLDECLGALYKTLGLRLRRVRSDAFYKSIGSVYRLVRKYIVTANLYIDSSMFYCEVVGDSVIVKSICVDPSEMLNERMDWARSSILFSATLTPQDYFIDILGGGKKAVGLALKSPFDEDNLFLAAIDDVSTRYEDRNKSLSRVVSYIGATVSCKKGNYMVYFPSYEYMNNVAELFVKKYPRVRTLLQKRYMTREDKQAYLDEFRSCDELMRVGFCVLGGSFSEGIDLPGNSLIGVVIVGTGIPGISSDRNIIRDYFEVIRETGYDYAYTYPGMNNVLQAAGRVIRSEADCGVVVLVDDRYSTEKYNEMYPEHWSKMKHFRRPISLNDEIKRFWRNKSSKNAKNDG